jgi:chaperone required for assembly of F1-ATPase
VNRQRRNYQLAAARPAEGGFGVRLDSRILTTPAGAEMVLPTEALAAAIAAEWQQQSEVIRPLTMPMMRLAATAIDRAPLARDAVIDEVAAYGGADLLCQRAAEPADLAAEEQAAWQPWLDWLERHEGIRLAATSGVLVRVQDKGAMAALRARIAALDNFALTGLQALTANLGSVVLALAVVRGALDAVRASELSFLEERFQARRWNVDEEAEKRRQAIAADVADVARFLVLARAGV